MSTLVVETLVNELVQEVTYNLEERVHAGSFNPYLYIHGYSDAVFGFQLSNSSGLIFEKTFTIQDIKDSLDTNNDYIRAYYPIIPANPIQIGRGNYTCRIYPISGYTSGATFIGWVKQHENIQNTMSYLPLSDDQNSLTIRFKSFKEGIHV